MFRTSPVHLQERFVQAVFADFGMWYYCAYYSTRPGGKELYEDQDNRVSFDLSLNGRNIPFLKCVKYLGKRIAWRIQLETVEDKAVKTLN